MYRDLTEIENAIKNDLENYTKELNLLKSIKPARKKNGEYFARAAANFAAPDGVKIDYYIPAHSLGYYPVLAVHGSLNGIYFKTEIQCYKYTDEIKDIENMPGEIHDNGYCKNSYIFTIDEITAAIVERMLYLDNEITAYKNQLLRAAKAYNEYQHAMQKVYADLRKNCGCENEKYSNTLYYAIRDSYTKY